ncbi:hypothetical protein acsn021_42580 [Anaerocolumna cellulosilytica]|uniref:Uncharacterized protein n=1 Tax=Anaerocolumna cellulosilytica TaxID=433286 RepID=A0A6S6R5S3_9FIRM|nr:DUF3791 domain-containing protein [Anaerocolumna cellulosilytica]MBB5195216.1 hypothetical protein [Anaerocolumna cellulosilytica]BCJ96689.1 hypothetical protein acsn021_42580 [Anaerocolumna cellulosilytica]
MSQSERDKNLIIVEAIEGYAYHHKMNPKEVFELFWQNGILTLLRSQYHALHTQSLEESIYFVEDVLRRKSKDG